MLPTPFMTDPCQWFLQKKIAELGHREGAFNATSESEMGTVLGVGRGDVTSVSGVQARM